jgi:DNA-binding NarL/FixJ family response regulator
MKRLLVVHRFPVVRYGLVKLVEEHLHGVVAAEAGTASQALHRVREAPWDVVVIGFSFGGQSGLEILKAIKKMRPDARVLVFSSHSEDVYVRRTFKAGADGYVTKDSSRAEVVFAIQTVMSGDRYERPERAQTHVSDRGPRCQHPHRVLSDREFEVMRLLASGRTVGEIASLMLLSGRTISTYRARLLRKLSSAGAR